MTITSGSTGVADVCLEHDLSTDGYHITVGGGSFQGEVSWSLLDENGNEVVSGGAPYDEYVNCEIVGCTDSGASNYNSMATIEDGSCEYPIPGCTDSGAYNYDSLADTDDGSCEYAANDSGSLFIKGLIHKQQDFIQNEVGCA